MGVPQTLRVLPPGSQITVLPGDKMRADDTKIFAAYVRWLAEPLPQSFPERAAPLARFASGLSLLDVRSERAAQGLTLRLRWSKSRAAVAPALLSVQAVALPARELARQEDLVGTPYYPPSLWDAGSVVEQRMTLPLPAGDATHLRLELRELDSGKSAAVIASRAARQADALIVPIAASTTH
jgi:hypothetical protein